MTTALLTSRWPSGQPLLTYGLVILQMPYGLEYLFLQKEPPDHERDHERKKHRDIECVG